MDVTETLGVPKDVIEHPFSSKLVAKTNDVDAMFDMLKSVKEQVAMLIGCERDLRKAIASHSTSSNKTSRVKGSRYTLKVTRPNDYWSQSDLKSIWSRWPEAQTYLRISTLAPNMVEVKKLEGTAGDEEFERWKSKLLAARSESTSAPTVTEEVKKNK